MSKKYKKNKSKWQNTWARTPVYKKAPIFQPHTFKTETILTYSFSPKILITPEAFKKMFLYVDIATEEVGWLGTVRRDKNNFIIEDCFLLEQEVSSVETLISPNDFADFAQSMMEEGHPTELIKDIRFWGHSHVNFGTSPSKVDEDQMDIFGEHEVDWFIRGILNKKERMEFSVFMYNLGIVVKDVPWRIYYDIDTEDLREEIKKEIDEKVTSGGWYYRSGMGYMTTPKKKEFSEDLSLVDDEGYGFIT